MSEVPLYTLAFNTRRRASGGTQQKSCRRVATQKSCNTTEELQHRPRCEAMAALRATGHPTSLDFFGGRPRRLPPRERERKSSLTQTWPQYLTSRELLPNGNCYHKTGDLAHKTGDLAHKTGDLAHKTGNLAHKTGDLAHKTGDLAHKIGDLAHKTGEREFFIDNLLVRIHFIIEMLWWTGLAPWEF